MVGKMEGGERHAVKRKSLETDVFTTAKLRLPDTLKELRKPEFIAGTFGQARADKHAAGDAFIQTGYRLPPEPRIPAALS